MAKSKKNDLLQAPQYRGGKKAMVQFIKENLQYPDEAMAHGIEGTVEVEFSINGMGKISGVKVKKGLGYGCDEEAVRLIKSLVFEKAYNRGLNTLTKRSLRIHFKLPEKPGIKLNYQITGKKPVKEPSIQKPRTYSITVNIPSRD